MRQMNVYQVQEVLTPHTDPRNGSTRLKLV